MSLQKSLFKCVYTSSHLQEVSACACVNVSVYAGEDLYAAGYEHS